jgi:hypothetical protein
VWPRRCIISVRDDRPDGLKGERMTSELESTLVRDLQRRLQYLEDREAIRDVLYLYARGADRCDVDLFKSCYWPDAYDAHWFYNGNAWAFADYVIELLAQIPNSHHSITNPIIEFDADRAFVECQWYVVHRVPLDGSRFVDQQVEGRYLDVFERRGEEWRILHRQIISEASREHVTTDARASLTDESRRQVGQRKPNDPVYRKFGIMDEHFASVQGADLWTATRERHAAQ